MIKAIRVQQYGGPEELRIEEIERPEAGAGEVLIRVYAAGVNSGDWKIRGGAMRDAPHFQLPYIPGYDLAGIIEEVGPDVTEFQKGQAVFGQSHTQGTSPTTGAYTEYTTAPVSSLALKPSQLTFEAAAGIPVPATAAWLALFKYGNIQAGQRVLIQGAAGGVGLFAVQFARWKGAHVIATTSTSNLDFVRSLGAETVIDYTTTAIEEVVQDVDLVVDTVGGETLTRSFNLVKRGGKLISTTTQPDEEKARERDLEVAFVWGSTSSEQLRIFARLVEENQIKILVSARFSLQEAPQAHLLSQKGHGRGRIVLHIAD